MIDSKMKLMHELLLLILVIFEFYFSEAALCRTSNDHKNYTCSGFRLKQFSVPRNTRKQILRVRAYDCKETHIEEEALQFPILENLTISCDVETLHENAFKNLNRLRELDLGNNTISNLPSHLFEQLGTLLTLNLSGNYFTELDEYTFEGLNGLKQLFLSHNNILKLGMKTFDATGELKEIYMNNNELRIISSRVFNKLQKLRTLDLSYNTIDTLGSAFTFTHSLVHLNLSHNKIRTLESRMFQTTRLEVLDLSYNELTVVYEDTLPLDMITQLYLQNNKISLFDVTGAGSTKFPLNYLDLQNNRLVFLEDSFITAAINMVSLKIKNNPLDCTCFERMEKLRQDISIDVRRSDQLLCVMGNIKECNVNKNNVTYYYTVYKEELELQ